MRVKGCWWMPENTKQSLQQQHHFFFNATTVKNSNGSVNVKYDKLPCRQQLNLSDTWLHWVCTVLLFWSDWEFKAFFEEEFRMQPFRTSVLLTHQVTNERQRADVTPRTVRCSLKEVWNALDQEISVFEVGKQEVHLVLGADGDRTWQDAAAICLLYNGHLWNSGWLVKNQLSWKKI